MPDFLKNLLPWIGAAATGNVPALVTMAATAVGNAVGVPVKADTGAIAAAVSNATPEQISALKQAEADFALKMQALGFGHLEAMEKLAAGDRADARARETQTGDHLTPRVLAAFAVACFVGLVYSVLSGMTPAEGMKDTFLILIGAAIAVFKDVYGYYFGSSAGSREKDKLIAG